MIAVTIDDLAFVSADAIARPVNADLRAITPVVRRLEEAAGAALLSQLTLHEPLDVGAAVVTGAGALEVAFMIHAVVATDTRPVTRDGVRRAMVSALQRAHDFSIARLAITPFGLGAGNLDIDDSAQTMVGVMSDHRMRGRRPDELTVVVENALEESAFRAAIARYWRVA